MTTQVIESGWRGADALAGMLFFLEQLQPHARNARQHGTKSVEAIKASFDRFGQQRPVLIHQFAGDERPSVISGNGGLFAARDLGWRQIAAVPFVGTDEEAEAYAIADNRTAELSEWDRGVLDIAAAAMKATQDLAGLYDALGLDNLLRRTEVATEDAGMPNDLQRRAKKGEVWAMGRHRVACGDATREPDVEKLLAGAHPALCVTDPPYGVDYDRAWRKRAGLHAAAARGGRVVTNDHRGDWREAFALFPGEVAYVWHAGLFVSGSQAALEAAGFEVRAQIVWAKRQFVIGRGHYHWQHESCWYAVRGKAMWSGGCQQTTLWSIDSDPAAAGGHPTQKPVEAMARAIRNHKGDVYDPFVGSGTTVIAAEKIGRTCLAMDLDPRWVDATLQRWETFTGGKAERVAKARG